MAITIRDMTTRETALKLVEELPESRLELLIQFLASQQKPGDVIDEWGNLSAMTRASTVKTMRQLDEQEREAGCEPW
jgi:hypothetical protein